MAREPEVFQLDNGLTVIHHYIQHSRLVHCGFLIDGGTRDENSHNNGIAHFIEHASFKGTKRRKPFHILNRIETVGGELEAYTDREKTCFYTSSLKKYADRSIELLTDLLFNAIYPEVEIQKERRVIREEIEMYEDTPEESIYDDFHSYMYPNQPMGYNILGTRASLQNINREKILQFLKDHYTLDNMVLSVAGNITRGRLEKIARKYLGNITNNKSNKNREKPEPTKPFHTHIKKDFHQSHCIMGSYGYSRAEPKRYALALLNNILGAAGMSSRLNMSIREKYGYVYQIGSVYVPYIDTGLFSVDFSTDQQYLDKCINIIFREFKKLKEEKLGKIQLNKAKRQMLGSAALMEENPSALMQSEARSYLDYERVIPMDEFFNNIEAVTAQDVQEVANEVLDEAKMSILVYDSKN